MTIAYLDWSLTFECGSCGAVIDLAENDDDAVVANAIFHNNWDALKGYEVVCENCVHENRIDSVEH